MTSPTQHDLTTDFLSLRHVHHPHFSATARSAEDESVLSAEQDASAPPWTMLTRDFHIINARLTENIHLLNNLYTMRLENVFDSASEQAQDEEIRRCSDSIRADLRESEKLIKLVPQRPGSAEQRTQQDLKVMGNAMKSMGIILNAKSRAFRKAESIYVSVQNERRHMENTMLNGGDKRASQLDEDMIDALEGEQELSSEQMQQLENVQANSRDSAIINIAKGVNELATLFGQLNVLVIEQGSILDRIDYNCEDAVEYVKKGVVDLEDADKISKKGISTKCILILVMICAILILAVIIKKSA